MNDQQGNKLSAVVQGLPTFATHYGGFTAEIDTIRSSGRSSGTSSEPAEQLF